MTARSENDVRLQRAQQLLDGGRGRAALEAVEEILRLEPRHPRALFIKGVAHFRMGGFEIAEEVFHRLVQDHPSNTQAHYYLGLCVERQRGLAAAVSHYQRTLELSPNHEQAAAKLREAGIRVTPPPPPPPPSPSPAGQRGASLRDPGTKLLRRHRRMRSFSLTFVVATLLVGIAVLAALTDGGDVARGALLLGIAAYTVAALRSAFTIYTFYQRRIDIQKGVLFRVQRSIWVYEIMDMSLSRSPIDLLTGDASVHIQGNFGAPRVGGRKKSAGLFKFRGIGNHRMMHRFWQELRDLQIEQRREMKNWFI